MSKPLSELMEEFEAERLAEIERHEARLNTPEALAVAAKKKAEEFERGVRLGWWDAEGNHIEQPEEIDEEEEE